MILYLLSAYILGCIVMFLLLSHSANWMLTKHNLKNILTLSLLTWVGVAAVILVIMYDIEIDD